MSDAKQVVAVTGANGFVGRHLCATLVQRGVPVRAVVRGEMAPPGTDRRTLGSLLEQPALEAALDGTGAVVHLAARVHVMRESAADSMALYRRENVAATETVCYAAAAAGVRTIILASSVKAIGEHNEAAWTAATIPAPSDPYGVSKLEAERAAQTVAEQKGMRVVILRFPLIYGPGMRGNMLRLFQLVARGLPLPLGGVDNRRSLAYVGNVAAAIAGALDVPGVRGAYFVSDGEDISTPDLIRRIARALGTPARLITVPPVLMRAVGRAGDLVARLVPMPLTSAAADRLLGSLTVNAGPLAELLGPPPLTLDQGLAATAEWFLAEERA